MRGGWPAEHILMGLAGGVFREGPLWGRRCFPRWRAILWRLAQDGWSWFSLTTRHPRQAVTQRSLPLMVDLPQDGPGDAGGGPLLPVTLRSSGQRSRAGARTKKTPRGVRPHPDGRPSDGGRDRRWREPLRRRRSRRRPAVHCPPAQLSAGATHVPKQTARVTLAAARSTPCCATALAGSPKRHEPSPPGHVRPQGA